jgi:hypothetical protein
MQEPGLSAAEFRFDPLVSTHPASTPQHVPEFRAKDVRSCRAGDARASKRAGFVDSRALCVTPGAAVSWSIRWWLLLWPSRRVPATAASFCDSSRPRAARAPARSPERERHVLAYRARILRPAISWPLPLCGKGELGPPVTWSALGGRPERHCLRRLPTSGCEGRPALGVRTASPPGWRRDSWQDLW